MFYSTYFPWYSTEQPEEGNTCVWNKFNWEKWFSPERWYCLCFLTFRKNKCQVERLTRFIVKPHLFWCWCWAVWNVKDLLRFIMLGLVKAATLLLHCHRLWSQTFCRFMIMFCFVLCYCSQIILSLVFFYFNLAQQSDSIIIFILIHILCFSTMYYKISVLIMFLLSIKFTGHTGDIHWM